MWSGEEEALVVYALEQGMLCIHHNIWSSKQLNNFPVGAGECNGRAAVSMSHGRRRRAGRRR